MPEITSPLKAIRAYCLDCTCNQIAEVRACEIANCPLHPFRFGKNPFRKNDLSEEERAKRAERLREIKEKNKETAEVG